MPPSQQPSSQPVNQPVSQPINQPVNRLVILPSEVQIQIISYLPTKDVARLRIVHPVLKIVIERNQNAIILRPRINPAIANISATLRSVVYYEPGINFTTALVAYLLHRGIALIQIPGIQVQTIIADLNPFAESWARFRSASDLRTPEGRQFTFCRGRLAEMLVRQHIVCHAAQVRLNAQESQDTMNLATVIRDNLPFAQRIGKDQAWLREICRSVRVDNVLKGCEWPREAITHNASHGRLREQGCVSVTGLRQMLGGLPPIPDNEAFAYCVETVQVYDLVRFNQVGDCMFRKAAVLEDLFLF
ncbi:hypothetical protein B0A50_03700 [Salinomyces thailandicus]|uniref:F-box domain-containing protein n=1 Tax=Salinomyces thailandicus TaxID=706561 RepID=A0A4U0U2I2_9PEZI|nr:hypothetical protein B0A50_03700 [Salinomyces thailandica]